MDRQNGRSALRERRRRELLEAAWEIVTAEGLDGLTMQRITDRVGCAEGTLYNYFATREELLADMEITAMQVIGLSVVEAVARVNDAMDDDTDPAVRSLAVVVASGTAWIDAEGAHPREVELSRRIFTHHSNVFSLESGAELPTTSRPFIDMAALMFDEAADRGALSPGDGFARAVTFLAGSTGVLLASTLARWDGRVEGARGFAHDLLRDLLLAWGADAAVLADASAIAASVSAEPA